MLKGLIYVDGKNNKNIFFKTNKPSGKSPYVYKIYEWQYPFVKDEIRKIGEGLSRCEYTDHLWADFYELVEGEFIFKPYISPKRQIIEPYPCRMDLSFKARNNVLYGIRITYGIDDTPVKIIYFRQVKTADGISYSVHFNNIDGEYVVNTAIISNRDGTLYKVHHIKRGIQNDN